MSTNKPLLVAVFLLLSGGACGPTDPASPSIMNARFATSSANRCAPSDISDVRGSIDSLQFQTMDETGRWQTAQRIDGPFDTAQEYDLQPLAATSPARVLACFGDESRWLAYTATPLTPNTGQTLPLLFTPIDSLSCTDSIDTSGAVQQLRWISPRGFTMAATLDDHVLLVGGADRFDRGENALLAAEVSPITRYNPSTTRFTETSTGATDLLRHRVGGLAFETSHMGERGLAVVGGTAALRPDISGIYGPFTPLSATGGSLRAECGAADRPNAFIKTSGEVVPLSLIGGKLVPRVLGQHASNGDVTVIAGGVECDESGPRASRTVEVIRAGSLVTLQLPVSLAGASVSPLSGGRFLIWGYDLENCGQSPGWLLTTAGEIQFQRLQLNSQVPNPCEAPPENCQAWHPSAYHTATSLTPRDGAQDAVLILGGLSGRGAAVANNPLVRSGCAGNGFVLSVMGNEAAISPITRAPETPSAHRAFHSAQRIGGEVIVSGGWIASPQDSQVTPTPGAFYASSDLLIFDEGSRTLRLGGRMATPRLGHHALHIEENRALLIGGLRPGNTGEERLQAASIVEVWTGALRPDGCIALSGN